MPKILPQGKNLRKRGWAFAHLWENMDARTLCHRITYRLTHKVKEQPVVSDPPPTTANGDARAIWPSPRRQASGKGYLGPLAPMPVKSYRAEYSHSSRNSCNKDKAAVNSSCRLTITATTTKSNCQWMKHRLLCAVWRILQTVHEANAPQRNIEK